MAYTYKSKGKEYTLFTRDVKLKEAEERKGNRQTGGIHCKSQSENRSPVPEEGINTLNPSSTLFLL